MKPKTCSVAARTPRRGFTLVEAMICSVLLVIGFVALVAAFGHDSVVAQRGESVMRATYLADEIRDMALQMSFNDVLNLNGAVYDTAVLSTGSSDNNLTGWSQHLTVTPVSISDLNDTVPAAGAQAARLTVEVRDHKTPAVTQTYYLFEMQGVPFADGGG
ncbi:MAG TPA: prepilin-type N-terminal cleavage/methylation domain-containing protein [Phycisphaerae bacterium]|nr:prepilin-type N-terminal cleavage/methylation domain-containing protein [Phycisphaerae bacterium]